MRRCPGPCPACKTAPGRPQAYGYRNLVRKWVDRDPRDRYSPATRIFRDEGGLASDRFGIFLLRSESTERAKNAHEASATIHLRSAQSFDCRLQTGPRDLPDL